LIEANFVKECKEFGEAFVGGGSVKEVWEPEKRNRRY